MFLATIKLLWTFSTDWIGQKTIKIKYEYAKQDCTCKLG